MNKRTLIAVLAGIGAALYVNALYWANGFDFDTRGSTAVTCMMFSVMAAFVISVITYAHLDE